jgi:tetratricopeptide (TPR) repeat protein
MDTWLEKAQQELNGKTPKQVILEERRKMGNRREDLPLALHIRQARDFNYNKAKNLFFRAMDFYEQGSYQEAIEFLEQVIQIDPLNYKVWGNMAACYGQLGNGIKAKRCLLKALSINTDYEIAKINLKNFE